MTTIDPITKLILQGRKNADGTQHFYPHDVDGGSAVTLTISKGQVSLQTETNLVTAVTANPVPTPASGSGSVSVGGAGAGTTTPPATGGGTTPPPATTPPPVTQPPVSQPPATSGLPPKLSGIKFNQPYPVGPDSKFNTVIGWSEPIGGNGPAAIWTTSNNGNGKYQCRGDGKVTITGVAPLGTGDDTFELQCTDGRGDQVTATFHVLKTSPDASGLALNTPATSYAFSPYVRGAIRNDLAPTFTPVAYGAKHGDVRQDSIGVWVQGSAKLGADGKLVGTPHPIWGAGGGNVYSRQGGQTPPVGEYPVTITASNPNGDVQFLDTTLRLLPVPPISNIEFGQTHPVSTATAVGEVIGYLAVTTPTDGAPQFSLIDPSGVLFVDPNTRQVSVVKTPSVAGPLKFTVHVGIGSGTSSADQDFTINVLQGQVLDPGQMALPVSPNLDNSTPAQVIGTATVKGQTGGVWRVQSQNNYNVDATTGFWGTPGRYQVDPKTGQVFTGQYVLLSYQNPAYGHEQDQITLTWTSDDGAKTCTQSFPIPVKEAPEKIVYVGPGMKAKYGDASVKNAPASAQGLDTLLQANQMCMGYHPGVKYRFKCMKEPADLALADGTFAPPKIGVGSEYYTDGTRDYSTRAGWKGPVAIDVTDLTQRPRGGGWSNNTGVNSGVTSGGKGFFLFSDGDAELIGWRVSGVHGGSSNQGIEGVRKDGNTYGNLALIDVQIDNCDQGFESGPIHGNIYLRRTVIRRCGGASVGAGLTHNVYCGSVNQILVEDSFFGEALWGHLFKSRAKKTIVRNSRFLDTASTAAACPMDICNFGDVTLEGNFVQKGPMAANPAAINLGAEGSSADLNLARINNNTIVVGAISNGGNYGACVAIMHYHLPSINNGPASKITGDGNQVWLSPLNNLTGDDTANFLGGAPVPPNSTVLTNTKLLTGAPPAMNLTNPTTGEPFEMMTLRPYRHAQILESRQPYPNFNGALQEISTLAPSVAASAPAGTVVFTGRATTDIAYFGAVGHPEPFGPGTTYAWNMTGPASWVYNHAGNPNPWAPADSAGNPVNFGLTVNPDGTYAVTYLGGLQPGGYYLRIVGTAPDGKAKSDQRFLVAVT